MRPERDFAGPDCMQMRGGAIVRGHDEGPGGDRSGRKLAPGVAGRESAPGLFVRPYFDATGTMARA